ncbi:hypothetical protein PY254_08815 [Rhodanobacter sp. AS-Z3]|uniref:hypothetical protein n=1 Tax=Rhodanobacter sp. AS-Z3 TaxID=3031330 RepID=UPI0024798320|nr:hypothetical protein [Rhodanobacter sp. AS-Z3]WEN16751.1 hypothetical protein PY254_08815 [Rhodanobacter sp. AS-Z3]
MKSNWLASLLVTVVLVGAGTMLVTQAGPARAAVPADQAETITVFVDATFGFRKKHMATQLTKSHADYAARGYRYVDMAPYLENGDLVGVFVTYTRQ